MDMIDFYMLLAIDALAGRWLCGSGTSSKCLYFPLAFILISDLRKGTRISCDKSCHRPQSQGKVRDIDECDVAFDKSNLNF
ncbi:MAG: hypothetical protein ACXIT4_10595 [Erythrobacter sp.]